jgi:vacuolar protein sorting-associated protein 11
VIAEVHRRAGDALYSRRDYGAAVAEYCETVGCLEPSYVIRRFLDAQRIHNLAAYLAHLHAKVNLKPSRSTFLYESDQA